MTLRAALNCLILLAMSFTAGCGGGGGGGGGNTNPPGGGSTLAALTTDNATLAAALGTAFLESYVQLTLSSLNNVFDLAESGQLSVAMNCGLGSGTITLVDNDGNGQVSAGDRVELDYGDCLQGALGDAADGRINVDIVSLSVGADLSVAGDADVQIPASLTINDGSGAFVDVSGAFRVSFVATPNLENLEISASGAQELRIVIRDAGTSVTETAQQVSVTRRIENGGYVITGSADIDSETLGGEMSCDVTTSLVGDLAMFPTTGTLECVGRSGSTVRVVAAGAGGIVTEVDPEGDGTFVDAGVISGGNGLWDDYVEGQLFVAQIDRPNSTGSGGPPDLASESLAIDVVDAAFSATDGRLYVTNDAGVAVVDTATMTQVDFLAVADRPGPIAVSDDGSTIWVGFRDVSEIAPVDVATLTEGTRIPLGVGVSIPLDRFATFLRVAPGATDTVVVASDGTSEVLAFSGGAQLPNLVDEFGAATMFEFRDATTIVGIHDSSTAFAATLMSLDANGLTLLRNLRNYSQNFNQTLALDGGVAWISYGRAIDVDNELVLGRVDFDPFGGLPFRDGVYVDGATDRAWFYSDGERTLEFFDTETFLAQGQYRVATTGQMIEMLGTPNGNALLVFGTEIHRVDLSGLQPNFVAPACTTLDLGGQLGTAVFLQLECAFDDAVYDAARDLIYASVPSAAGRNGNSVAVISPQTGAIQSYIPVGSEPGRLSISGGGTRLYVALEESNRVAVVDLQSQQALAPIRVEDEPFLAEPGFALAIAASTQNETDVLVTTAGQAAIYSNGARLVDVGQFARDLVEVFYSADATRAYGLSSSRLWTFDVAATGLTNATETFDVMQHLGTKIENDRLYDRLGAIVDPETAAVVATCTRTATSAVEPDPASDDVYYLQTAFDSFFEVCDEGSLTITGTFQIPRFGSGFFRPRLTMAGSSRIAIINSDKMLLLDPNEF